MPKSTLADMNEKKDWHIYQDYAMILAERAKVLYKPEFGIRRAISVHNSESITTLTVTIAGDKIPKMSFGLNSF